MPGGIKVGVRAGCVMLALAACGHDARVGRPVLGPPPLLPEQRHAARVAPQPEWYWEPVVPALRSLPRAVELPVAESALVRVEGATRVWDDLGAEGRERLRRDGLVVLPSAAGTAHMGAFYMDMRAQRVPYVLTLDALAYVLHVAFERALAEVDEAVLVPELEALVTKLEARMAAEQKGAGMELGEALRLARGIVAVARGLITPGAAVPDPELAMPVHEEIARVVAHARPAPSALLGATIDYARFAAPSRAARPGHFRALAWLASTPLVLVAQSEAQGATVGVATARLNARTAMLLARVADREVDAGIHASWSKIARLLTFVWGPSDDLAPAELIELASSIGVNLEDPKHVANVVTVDRVRHRAAKGREPLLFDGNASPGRAGIGMRLFGGHAPPDSVALASLVGPQAGPALGDALPAPDSHARDGRRTLPSTLDLAVWIGAPEARVSLHASGGDGFAGYDAALARSIAGRPGDGAASRHASVHGSLLDVVMTWLAPAESGSRPASPAAHRAAIESALAAWTYARHADQPLARPAPSRPTRAAKELHVTGAALPAFVEAAPEVIARLVATLGQLKRGLAAIGSLPPTSPAMVALAEVDDILRVALRVSSHEANDEALSPEDVAALASLPARLARLEESADDAVVPVVAEVFVDPRGDRVMSTATGAVEPAVMVVREPATGRPVVAVGAHIGHYELIERRAERSTDASHRARFGRERDHAPPRGAYTNAFRLLR